MSEIPHTARSWSVYPSRLLPNSLSDCVFCDFVHEHVKDIWFISACIIETFTLQ